KSPRREEYISNYIPIRIVSSNDIIRESADRCIHYGEFIESYFVPEFLEILYNKLSVKLVEILKYCIREIIRNIIEHSKCSQFAICGQFYKERQQVSLAIVDIG